MSSVVSIDLASSTVIVPSCPTFSMASAMMLPMVVSPLAEIDAMAAMSGRPLTGTDIFLSSSTTQATALSMPRLTAMASAPAVTASVPCRKIASASTVAVVVPSPVTSLVFEATSRIIWAPMFA